MLLTDDFDPSLYMSNPRLDVPSQIALGRQLLAAAPGDLPRPAEGCKRALAEATGALEVGYREAQSTPAVQLRRPVDLKADNSWSSVKARLDPYVWLDPERFPVAARAQALVQKLFPSGLSFLHLEYGAQWAEADWRIRLIADENLEPELRRLCGDLFIDELLLWHREYGKMVGTVRHGAKPAAERASLAELRRQAAQAVVAWQAQLVALHLAGHPGARAALRPTDEYREKLAAAAPKPAADPEPTPGPAAPAPIGATPAPAAPTPA